MNIVAEFSQDGKSPEGGEGPGAGAGTGTGTGTTNASSRPKALKNVYPGGFNVRKAAAAAQHQHGGHGGGKAHHHAGVSGSLLEGSIDSSVLLQQFRGGGGVGGGSFMSWTRGEYPSDNSLEELSDVIGDPFADVAGPTLRRGFLQRGERDVALSPPPNEFGIRISQEMKLSVRDKGKKTVLTSALTSPPKVFPRGQQQPTYFSNARPSSSDSAGGQTDDGNVSVNGDQLSYDDWLREHSTTDQSLGTPNGPHAIKALSSMRVPHNSPVSGGNNFNSVTTAPKAFPRFVVLRLYSYKSIMQSTNARIMHESQSDDRIDINYPLSVLYKFVQTTLHQSVGNTVRLAPGSFSSRATGLSLFYFHTLQQAWKPITSESDWNQAKMAAFERDETVKIMYSLGKQHDMMDVANANNMLVSTHNSEPQHDNVTAQSHQHQVSLTDLTPSLTAATISLDFNSIDMAGLVNAATIPGGLYTSFTSQTSTMAGATSLSFHMAAPPLQPNPPGASIYSMPGYSNAARSGSNSAGGSMYGGFVRASSIHGPNTHSVHSSIGASNGHRVGSPTSGKPPTATGIATVGGQLGMTNNTFSRTAYNELKLSTESEPKPLWLQSSFAPGPTSKTSVSSGLSEGGKTRLQTAKRLLLSRPRQEELAQTLEDRLILTKY